LSILRLTAHYVLSRIVYYIKLLYTTAVQLSKSRNGTSVITSLETVNGRVVFEKVSGTDCLTL